MSIIRSRHVVCLVALLLSEGRAYPQGSGRAVTTQVGYPNSHNSAERFGIASASTLAAALREQRTALELPSAARWKFRWSTTAPDDGTGGGANRKPAPAFQTSSGGRQRSTGRKVLGGIIGAVGGFFGGGFLGAAIEGDRCDCDDPGLVGFLIGAPSGAVVGAIVGAKFF